MKVLNKFSSNSIIFSENNFFFCKFHVEKKSKGPCRHYLLKDSEIKISLKKNINLKKNQFGWKEINSTKNIRNFRNLFSSSVNWNINEKLLIENKFQEYYPSKQNFSVLNLNNIEQIGVFYFSLYLLSQNKIFYEFIHSRIICFPIIINSNWSTLNCSDTLEIFPDKIENKNKSFFSEKIHVKKTAKNENQESFFQIFFSKKVKKKFLEVGFKCLRIFSGPENEIYFRSIKSTENFSLNSQKFFNFCPFGKKTVFELKKTTKKSQKMRFKFLIFREKKGVLLEKAFTPRLRINKPSIKGEILFNSNLEFFRYSKNISQPFFSKSFFERIPCSILISPENVPKINRILENIEFSRLQITFYQIENIKLFNSKQTIQFASEFKSSNQRIIVAVCDPYDIKLLNFIFSISILPKIHCLKLFSGFKGISSKNRRIFLIKKSLEKSFIFYPISFSSQPNCFLHNTNQKNFNIGRNSQFQENFPKFEYEIDITLWLDDIFSRDFYKNYITEYNFKKKKLYIINQNSSTDLFFYYSNLIFFQEILFFKSSFLRLFKKKTIRIFFFQYLFFFAITQNSIIIKENNKKPKIRKILEDKFYLLYNIENKKTK